MALKNNTWTLNAWYDQDVAGNISYSGTKEFWAWGTGATGQLAQNNTTQYSSPKQIPGATWIGEVSTGLHNYNGWIANKTDGELWACGDNNYGEAGQNSTTPGYSSPIQIPGTWGGTALTRGLNSRGAVKSDGTLWMWGRNRFGSLGQNQGVSNNQYSLSSPTQVGTDATWTSTRGGLCQGYWVTAAIKTDGTLWTWGANEKGALGINVTSEYARRSSPTQVGTDTTWSKLGNAGYNGFGAVKTDGTLWIWGNNEFGVLANSLAHDAHRSSPVQVPGTTWANVTLAQGRVMATKTDGTLWAWGTNGHGTLGQNAPENSAYSSPVQIPGTNWHQDYFGVGEVAGALKTDGTAWTWGVNSNGHMGDGTTTSRSSPTQIPGTTWAKLYHLNSGFAAKKNI